MRIYDIIRKKRDRAELAEAEIEFFVQAVTNGSCSEPQASALLMAIFINGMSEAETVALTRAMLASGSTLETSEIPGMKIDKHSTSGVGDKTSIILAPLLAAMGVKVPMISGRALGHTGGTLDKIETIPGLSTALKPDEMTVLLKDIGMCMAGPTEDIAPADRILYPLRDATATVESIPLIAASIMSKKLSEGLDGLVLDVKTGSGAFMESLEDARALARTMISIGNSMGVKTVAVISNMDQPLGRTVGNALELKECLSALRGRWTDDLRDLTLTLAARTLQMNDALAEGAELGKMTEFTRRSYTHEAMEFLEKGDVFKKFVEFVDAQGGDPEVVFNPSTLPTASHVHEIKAEAAGVIRQLDARAVGTSAMLLGAGRKNPADEIDPAAGIILNRKTGETVDEGELIAIMHTNDPALTSEAEEAFRSGLVIAERGAVAKPIIHEVVM